MNPLLRLLLLVLALGWGMGVLGTTAGAVLQPFGLVALGVLAAGVGVAVYLLRRPRP